MNVYHRNILIKINRHHLAASRSYSCGTPPIIDFCTNYFTLKWHCMRHWTCLWLLLRVTIWVPGGGNFGASVGVYIVYISIVYSVDVTHSCLAWTFNGNFSYKYYAELIRNLSFRVMLTPWHDWWCMWNRF